MKRTTRALAVALGLVVAFAGVATANYYDWAGLNNNTTKMQVRHWIGPSVAEPDGPETVLTVLKSPMSSGNVTLNATMTIQSVGLLSLMELQTAVDGNSNNMLDDSEWTTVAAGTIVELGGVTTATTGPVSVSGTLDGYRVRHVRTDLGTGKDTWVANGAKDIP